MGGEREGKKGKGRKERDLAKWGVTFSDELAVYFWRMVEFRQHDHAFADVFPPDPLQGEGGGLPGRADRHRDAFAFDGADGCRCELAEGVRADENGVAGVDETCGFGEWWLAGGEW